MGLNVSITLGGTAEPDLAQADALEIYERAGHPTRFRLRYPAEIDQGDLPLLVDNRYDGTGAKLVSISTSVNGKDHALVAGPIHGQRLTLQHGGGKSWFEVIGSDISILMDHKPQTVVWDNVSDSDVVQSILQKNSTLSLTPDVQQTKAKHKKQKHTLVQRDTDLRFIRRLAKRNGYLFWVTTDTSGTHTAHFRHPQTTGSSTDIVLNRDGANIDTLELGWDSRRPTSATAKQLDLNSTSDLDGSAQTSPLDPLGKLRLNQIASKPHSVLLSAPTDSTGDLTARSEAILIDSEWFLRGRCESSAESLGTVIHAPSLVKMRGIGSRHDGLYFVTGVRHQIDSSAHRMEISVARNGWES